MLKNQDIIYIANDWVNDNKTSAHHIAEVLAKANTVLYVEGAGMRRPRASKRDIKKIVSKIRKAFSRPTPVLDSMYLCSPLILPFHRHRFARAINRGLLRFMLWRACRSLGLSKPLLWIFMPHYRSAIESVTNSGVVYYVVDEYSSQPMVDVKMIQTMEREILEKADVVFTVSEELRLSKAKINPNTYLSRHGVDVELFRRATDPQTKPPADLATISRPIAGFFGLIEDWLDLDLIEHLAAEMSEISFVFIGRIVQDVSRLARFANVHFLGEKSYESLPDYLSAFDVCMLLYKKDVFSKNANPKKLREYLAGGKPVVSVPVREVEEYADYVYIAANREQYVECIRRALDEDSPQRVQERLAAVSNDSWDRKVERLGAIIKDHLMTG
jgi:glycosyltransferase involved in cell wall biosynthesis